MSPEGQAQLEFRKMQLVGSIQALSNSMRECAAIAEQYANEIAGAAYMPNPAAYVPLANGQYAMPIMPPMGQDVQGKKRKSRGDDSEGKKKAKKPKDPNAPKRPASSYLLFQNDVRNELKAQNPTMRNNELLSTIAKLWADMPPEQKDAYESRNKVLKDQWKAEKEAYESGKAGASASPVVASAPAPVAPAMPAIKAPPVAAPVAKKAESDDDTSNEEEEEEESDSSDEEDEEETAAPPQKKPKKEDAHLAAVKGESTKKEKKHKKSKA